MQDYFTTGKMQPSPDTTPNYMLTSAMERNGYTNLVFYRKRNTGDAQDVEIKVLNHATTNTPHIAYRSQSLIERICTPSPVLLLLLLLLFIYFFLQIQWNLDLTNLYLTKTWI